MLRDPDRVVNKQAILSLVELKDPRADLPLREIVNDRGDRELSMLVKQLIG
jgi:hypothetical protein